MRGAARHLGAGTRRATGRRSHAEPDLFLGRDPGLRQPATASSSRSQLASSRSVLTRRLRPGRARSFSARPDAGTAPAPASASHTNSPARARLDRDPTSDASTRLTQSATGADVTSIRPRHPSSDVVPSASNVICLRCTSHPPTIAIMASCAFRQLPPNADHLASSRSTAQQFMPSCASSDSVITPPARVKDRGSRPSRSPRRPRRRDLGRFGDGAWHSLEPPHAWTSAIVGRVLPRADRGALCHRHARRINERAGVRGVIFCSRAVAGCQRESGSAPVS